MKLTVIIGSARNNGSSSYLADTIIDGWCLDNANTFEKYQISDLNINYCVGCKTCYKTGKCYQNDDVLMIINSILAADYVVMISPSYWAGVPAQLKTFIDRSTPYGDTNLARINKNSNAKGISIALRAGTRNEENQLILDSIEHYFGHLGISVVKSYSLTRTDSLGDLINNYSEIIEELPDITHL
ncbi:flavodoxin family protein [Mollicutes bacterium LVI A0039]|nr:flavodoxin family protein [Mollicutes bacterium LVI A0039]